MLTVACVWTGDKYGPEYVERLAAMVARWLPMRYEFVCITDRLERVPGVDRHIETKLPGWWAKMELFNPAVRPRGRVLYFDLDTVICADLSPLIMIGCKFGICENFTKLAGHNSWNCNYGSCVMSLADGFGASIWEHFIRSRMEDFPRGDQQAIEAFYPGAQYLQDLLQPGYFVGYRDLTATKPPGAAVIVFAGSHKPHNSPHQWIKDAWQ